MRTPSTSELYEAIEKDLKAKLNLSNDPLKKVVNAFAGVLAAQEKLLYLFLGDIQNNIFPDTADLAENGGQLERIGRIHLNREPNAATAGVYQIKVDGEPNAVIRKDLTFKSNDDSQSPGKVFFTDIEQVLTGSDDRVEIRSTGGGANFLLNVGDELTITEPVIGVEQLVEIVEVVNQPKASESIEDYRQLILDAIQLEPQGGSKTDYRIWSADAQGVRKVYPYVKDGDAGTVQIYVEASQADSIDGEGTPTDVLLKEVGEVIRFDPDETKPLNDRGRKPIQANIETLSISKIPVDIDIQALNERNSLIENTIETNVKSFIREVRPFVDGADLARNKNDILYEARLQSVITDSIESSNFFTAFTMRVSGTQQTNVLFSRADIPFLNSINYV